MLEIKTIAHPATEREEFDAEVNEALAEGWELVRRDIIPPYEGLTRFWERAFYAELEREVAPEEEDEGGLGEDAYTSWQLTRDPFQPYRCEKCGFKDIIPRQDGCPNCGRFIVGEVAE